MGTPRDVTALLGDWSRGSQAALNQLLPLVYAELHQVAARQLRNERRDHTLQPTALVNEVFIRLVDQRQVDWQNRAHFFGVAAQVMRRVLVDHARRHRTEKRGGKWDKVQFEEALAPSVSRSVDVVALDDALLDLAKRDLRQSQIVELRFFGGLTTEEA